MINSSFEIRTWRELRDAFMPPEGVEFRGQPRAKGIELELFIVKKGSVADINGDFYIEGMAYNFGQLLTPDMFVAGADRLIKVIKARLKENGCCFDKSSFSREFSNCQIEINSMPFTKPEDVIRDIAKLMAFTRECAARLDWDLIGVGLAPDGVPKVPNPLDERYLRFAQSMPEYITDIMYRVAALHVHIAASTEKELFEIYNRLVRNLPYLKKNSDQSQGQRYRLFETALYPGANPPELRDWQDYFSFLRALGKLNHWKDVWTWVRPSAARVIKAEGQNVLKKPMTVEYRFPDASTNLNKISKILDDVEDAIS